MSPIPTPSYPSTPGQAPGTSQEQVQGRAFLFLWTSFGVLYVYLSYIARRTQLTCSDRFRLYGLTLHQAYGYARTFRSDARYIKVLVSYSSDAVLRLHMRAHFPTFTLRSSLLCRCRPRGNALPEIWLKSTQASTDSTYYFDCTHMVSECTHALTPTMLRIANF